MAYNNNFPMGYQPMYYPQYQQPMQQNMNTQTMQNVQPQQIQNGGFVNVQNEQEAKDYLVANGTSVTFLDTNNRKLYIKTKGFSSLDAPNFERYKLVKITEEEQTAQPTSIEYAHKEDIDSIKAEIEKLKHQMNAFTEKGVEHE